MYCFDFFDLNNNNNDTTNNVNDTINHDLSSLITFEQNDDTNYGANFEQNDGDTEPKPKYSNKKLNNIREMLTLVLEEIKVNKTDMNIHNVEYRDKRAELIFKYLNEYNDSHKVIIQNDDDLKSLLNDIELSIEDNQKSIDSFLEQRKATGYFVYSIKSKQKKLSKEQELFLEVEKEEVKYFEDLELQLKIIKKKKKTVYNYDNEFWARYHNTDNEHHGWGQEEQLGEHPTVNFRRQQKENNIRRILNGQNRGNKNLRKNPGRVFNFNQLSDA